MAPSRSAFEMDQEKRDFIDRKSKAAHFSRQLQLRLQYARLKVDNGWHKQNFYEVENLYFTRSKTQPRSRSQITVNVPSPTGAESAPDTGKWNGSAPAPISHYFPLSVSNPAHSTSTGTSLQVPASSNGRDTSTSAYLPTSLSHNRSQSTSVYSTSSSSSSGLSTSAILPPVQKQPPNRTVHKTQSHPTNTNSMPAYPASVSTPSHFVKQRETHTLFASTSSFFSEEGQNSNVLSYDSFWSSHGKNPLTPRPSLSFVVESASKNKQFGSGIGTEISEYPRSFVSVTGGSEARLESNHPFYSDVASTDTISLPLKPHDIPAHRLEAVVTR